MIFQAEINFRPTGLHMDQNRNQLEKTFFRRSFLKIFTSEFLRLSSNPLLMFRDNVEGQGEIFLSYPPQCKIAKRQKWIWTQANFTTQGAKLKKNNPNNFYTISYFFFIKSCQCQTNIATISYTIRPDDLDFRGITCKAEVGDKKITYSSVSGFESEPFRTVMIVHHRIVRL